MDRDEVIRILREHEPELKAAGIEHLRLFGSVARGEQRADSDLDLMVDLDESRTVSLLDIARLNCLLSDIMQIEVHMSVRKNQRDYVRVNAEREAIGAF